MSAEVAGSIARVRAWRDGHRLAGRRVGFVPTMGALHEGHARLIEVARQNGDRIIVSIFVNPLQFDRKDDLERYPRTLDADLQICNRLGVEFVFAPPVEEMYPAEPVCTVTVKRITDRLCGQFRPGHFDGVATVVTKLFEIVQPDVAYFGEKDAQQLAVIRRMVSDLNMPIQIAGVATVREADGLALSSRNARLSPEERSKATTLYRALREAERAIAAGERDARAVERRAAAVIPPDASLRLEYLEVVDPIELQRVVTIAGDVLVAGALWVGSTRLIDNITCGPARNSQS
ncbi:MAG TPA: pantoate--beta-alanine ligase [Vicinamibacterales bacterium]|nr:pantoate--beta-alanine ligase [Vicinamibacterales bacterium]